MTLYSHLFCTDQEVDLVGASSDLGDGDYECEGEEGDYCEDDDYNGDGEDFDELSLNEEAEIMQYAANATQSSSLLCVDHLTRCGKQSSPANEICLDLTNNRNITNVHHFNSPNFDLATTTCQNRCNSSDTIPSEKLFIESSLIDTKSRIIGIGIVLLVSTFAMLVLLPLYFQQMGENGDRYNDVFGATVFLSCNAALLFIIITVALGVVIKWKIPFYKVPLPWTKLITISSVYGLSCMLFASSYTRVPCHLQDPLKGVALVFSMVFYFFFCKKVMGLQRIFSATTAVVGLFVSMDYGLCDEFRCRGTDLTDKNSSVVDPFSSEWKRDISGALLYIASIALWALHLSLLESSLVLCPIMEMGERHLKPMGLLGTVSRIVSKSGSTLPTVIRTPIRTNQKIEDNEFLHGVDSNCELSTGAKVHPLHIVVWVHVLCVFVVGVVGSIDIFSRSGPTVKTLGQHWTDSGNTILCHFNKEIGVNTTRQEELTNNFVPGSVSVNETAQKAYRFRRSPTSNKIKLLHSLELHFNFTTIHHVKNVSSVSTTKLLNHTNTHNGAGHLRNEYANKKQPSLWKHVGTGSSGKHRANVTLHSGLKSMLNSDQWPAKATTSNTIVNCVQTQIYSLILLLFYIIFASCLINFLVISESAVFTICIVTGALPPIGIFWSLFEISFDTADQTVALIWSPEVSGELICSLLGMPIVFLGIGLFGQAYFREHAISLDKQFYNSKPKAGAPHSIYLSFDTTGLSDDSAKNKNNCEDAGCERTQD